MQARLGNQPTKRLGQVGNTTGAVILMEEVEVQLNVIHAVKLVTWVENVRRSSRMEAFLVELDPRKPASNVGDMDTWVLNAKALKPAIKEGKDVEDQGPVTGEILSIHQDNIKAQNTLTQILLKRQEKQMTDKDQKEMLKTAKVFGPALERIVGAIKDFSQLPEEA